MARVAVVVQARSGSTRLPKKWSRKIGDSDVIGMVHKACMDAKVGPAVMAIPEGDELGAVMRERKWLYVEGSEDDVLGRMIVAADAANADHIVRITADCPLSSSGLIRSAVREHVSMGCAFTTNVKPPSRAPDGLDIEVICVGLLRRLHSDALSARRKDWMEHVTLELYELWDKFALTFLMHAIEWTLPMGEQYSLDTEEDLERIRAHVARKG